MKRSRAPSSRASVSKRPDSIRVLISATRSARDDGRLIAFDTIEAFWVRSTLSAGLAPDGGTEGLLRVILFGPSIRPGPPTPSVLPMSIGCLPLTQPLESPGLLSPPEHWRPLTPQFL